MQDASEETFLLELLNSTPIVDGAPRDLLGPEQAASWLSRRGGSGSPAEQRAVRAARDALQAVVRGTSDPAVLAPLLKGVRSVPSLEEGAVTWSLDVPAARRLAVLAIVAWDAISRSSPGRLRPCANVDCALFLVDHSKPNQARWCSMASCGNRMKARRHYERLRTPK